MGDVLALDSLSGFVGWSSPKDGGIEFLGLTAVNSSYSIARWGLTYIPQPAGFYSGSSKTLTVNLDDAVRNSRPGQLVPGVPFIISEWDRWLSGGPGSPVCPSIDPTVYGILSIKQVSEPTDTICVFNCGMLPWRSAVTYSAMTGNDSAVFVPYQRFTMTFSGIDAAAFRINDHISFNRDVFQQRYVFHWIQLACVTGRGPPLAMKLPKMRRFTQRSCYT